MEVIKTPEEFFTSFNSLEYEYKVLLHKYFHNAEKYDSFEECYDTLQHVVFLHCDYSDVEKEIKIKIEQLINYHKSIKEQIENEFLSVIDKMKQLSIEFPENFKPVYHIKYFEDMSGKGYIIVPYLNREVAENVADMKQQVWTGKYGSTKESYIYGCGGKVELGGNPESPHKPFGIAIQDYHY